jgi:ArsR family metal-binding transcriptional regulator
MEINDLNLRIHEYCVDDDTITVEGVAPHSLDLTALAAAGRKLSSKVMLMDRLNVLYIVMNSVTIHLHKNGEIMVNRVKSLKEAENILADLIFPAER